MRAWTGTENQSECDRLEREAATVLGFMLFEYSRLDMELGLMLVSSKQGQAVEQMTTKINDYTFYKRLEFLQILMLDKYASKPEVIDLYSWWLEAAHGTRSIRNKLFHGRWGIDPMRQQVANVVGLPTSPDQREERYSISDLERELESMKALRSQLQKLRKSWPL